MSLILNCEIECTVHGVNVMVTSAELQTISHCLITTDFGTGIRVVSNAVQNEVKIDHCYATGYMGLQVEAE